MNKKKTIRRLLQYIGKSKIVYIVSSICSILCVVGALYIPIIVGKTIDVIALYKFDNNELIIDYLIEIILLSFGISFLQWVTNSINYHISYNVVKLLRTDLFNKIQTLKISTIDNHTSGDFVSRMISDADQVSDGLLLGFTQFISGLTTIIITILFMLYINPWMALIVIVLTPLSLIIARYISRKTYKYFNNQNVSRGDLTSYVDEMISNQTIVNSLNYNNECINRFNKLNADLKNKSLKAVFFSSLTNPSTRFVNNVVYAFVALIGAFICIKTNQKSLTIGILTSFLTYAIQYTKPFNEISGVFTELQNSIACTDRIFEILDEDSIEQLCSNEDYKDNDIAIEMKNITFGYNEKMIIKDFNLCVNSGEKVAIVGPTGCGKTTIINLLMKFYNPNSGDIYLNGMNYKELDSTVIRNKVGMVLQDTWLKNGTVRENLVLGIEHVDEDKLVDACKRANSYSFIKRLSNGFDTIIHNNGEELSQGQKQLICITRLMLRNPQILILDEATSSIDTRTEIVIQNAFDELMKNKTSIVVAHRLSTIKSADKIVYMNEGSILEIGTHNELLALKGEYYKLYNNQYIKKELS